MSDHAADISIVIPAYNAEKYIGRCLDSILNQKIQASEIVIVNDGSTDNTKAVIEAYQIKHNNIKLVNQKNSGVAVARNVGVLQSKQNNIWFVDADDEIMQNALEKIYENAHKADITICAYNMVFKNLERICDVDKKSGIVNAFEYIKNMMKMPNAFYYAGIWNKLFKRDIIIENNIKFETGLTWGEDFIFNMDYWCCCEKFNVVNCPVYKYYRNNLGLTIKSLLNMGIRPIYNIKIKYSMYKSYKKMISAHNLLEGNEWQVKKFIFGITLFV